MKFNISNSSSGLIGCINLYTMIQFVCAILFLFFNYANSFNLSLTTTGGMMNLNFSRFLFKTGIITAAAIFLQTTNVYAIQFSTFNNANDIPASFFKEEKEITGQVIKVIDGDTYRIRHLPFFFSSADFKGNLADKTISVRIAAIDCPETAKFGAKGQKYGPVAANFASKKVLGKKITVRLLSKDQYARVVGGVYYNEGPFKKDLGEELMKNGLAVVYRSKGGKYPNGGIRYWNQLEEKARVQKIGLWSEKKVELPSDYKKSMKQDTMVMSSKK